MRASKIEISVLSFSSDVLASRFCDDGRKKNQRRHTYLVRNIDSCRMTNGGGRVSDQREKIAFGDESGQK